MKIMDKVLIIENHNFFAGVLNAVILETIVVVVLVSLYKVVRLSLL